MLKGVASHSDFLMALQALGLLLFGFLAGYGLSAYFSTPPYDAPATLVPGSTSMTSFTVPADGVVEYFALVVKNRDDCPIKIRRWLINEDDRGRRYPVEPPKGGGGFMPVNDDPQWLFIRIDLSKSDIPPGKYYAIARGEYDCRLSRPGDRVYPLVVRSPTFRVTPPRGAG